MCLWYSFDFVGSFIIRLDLMYVSSDVRNFLIFVGGLFLKLG